MEKAKIIAKNRQAYFDYEILEKIECGIVLIGKEIKAIRAGKVDLTGSYARIMGQEKPELFWIGGNINLQEGSDRTKKLLVNKSELKSLIGKSQVKRLCLIPLEMYLKKGRAILLVSNAREKKQYDKRVAIKKKDIERDLRRNN